MVTPAGNWAGALLVITGAEQLSVAVAVPVTIPVAKHLPKSAIQKPLQDMDEVVARLSQLAQESLGRSREHTYLERIKARHERVLARYRSLPRDA